MKNNTRPKIEVVATAPIEKIHAGGPMRPAFDYQTHGLINYGEFHQLSIHRFTEKTKGLRLLLRPKPPTEVACSDEHVEQGHSGIQLDEKLPVH